MKQFIKLTLIKQKEKQSSFDSLSEKKNFEIEYHHVVVRADSILYAISEDDLFLNSGTHTYVCLDTVDAKGREIRICVKESVEEVYELLEKQKESGHD